MVPGLAAYILALTAVLLTTLTVAGEWERGSMEQLFASPVGRSEIVLGKLTPYLVLGLLELLLVVAFGAAVFDAGVGEPAPAAPRASSSSSACSGRGCSCSVITKNQLVATQIGLLGAAPRAAPLRHDLPDREHALALRLLSGVIPVCHMVHALREILLKGNGLDVLWPDLLAVVAFAVAVVALSTARFQRRLAVEARAAGVPRRASSSQRSSARRSARRSATAA